MEIPSEMLAMVLEEPGQPLRARTVPVLRPESDQVLIRVHACAVCRTDLHLVDGELPDPKLPIIPGHETVGTVVRAGERVDEFAAGDRVGIPWLGYTCGECRYCRRGQENLCDNARFTGYTIDGGYAQYAVAARRLGAVWAGGSDELPPEELDAAILFAPVGALVPAALRAVAKGGVVVSGGIHMSDIPSFPYRILREERSVRSAANLTRADGEELLSVAPGVPIRTEVTVLPLTQANEALARLRRGEIQGAVVLEVPHP
jgi:D-arabinose 1-dehydrogenase-like Zn-dependent alcohol dehydrogenase